MIVSIDEMKRFLKITDPSVAVEVVADAVGSTYNKTVTGDGIATLYELLGVGYTFESGEDVILGYGKSFAVSGGDAVTEASFLGNVLNATNDEFLLDQMAIVQQAMENYCGRVFEAQSYIQTFYRDEELQDHSSQLPLYHYPLLTAPVVTDITNNSPITAFRAHPPTATLIKVEESVRTSWFCGTNEIQVEYSAGLGTIPADLKSVMKALVEERWNKYSSGIALNFGNDVQRISVPGVMSIDFDYTLQTNERKNSFGMILGNYANVLDFYRSERRLVGTIRKAYVEVEVPT